MFIVSVGGVVINMTAAAFQSLEARFKELEPGGLYKPPDCRSRHKVAIVIPYRNREKHLKIFLNNMHPFLQKQQLEYGIYIVDQVMYLSYFIFWIEEKKRGVDWTRTCDHRHQPPNLDIESVVFH
jgi:hypothetical protein